MINVEKVKVLEKIILIGRGRNIMRVNADEVKATGHPTGIISYQGAYYMFDNGRYRYFARVKENRRIMHEN